MKNKQITISKKERKALSSIVITLSELVALLPAYASLELYEETIKNLLERSKDENA